MKKKFYSKKLFLFHLFQIFFLPNIYIKCNCDRNSPILKDNKCQSIYCTQNDFKNNLCKIGNEITKTQWLNNFINFNEFRFRFTNMIISEEGDLILITSPEDTNGQRLFFRLTKKGRGYFRNNEGKEVFTKTVQILDGNSEGAKRYESEIFLMKPKNDNNDNSVNNKEYLVSISLYKGFMEIYNLNDNDITFSIISIYDFGGYLIYSRKGSIVEFYDREYFYFFIANGYDEGSWNPTAVLKKFVFYDNNINKYNINNKTLIEDQKTFYIRFLKVVSAFKTELNQIVLFYLSSNSKFKIEVFDNSFTFLFEKYYDSVGNFNNDDGLFMKGIYLNKNIGIFAYYIDKEKFYPKIILEKISETEFNQIFSFELDKYEFNTDPLLNDLIKMNDKRFCFTSTSNDRLVLYIILLDLYNYDTNIKMRYYILDIYNLYNYKIFKDLSSIIYNGYLALSLSVCNSAQCEDKNSDLFYTTLLIFSYINASDYNINISSYFSNKNNNNEDDIYSNFTNYFRIDNNIFGFQITQKMKVKSIPNELILYKSNNNKKIQINIGDEFIPSNEQLLISQKNNIINKDLLYYIECQYFYSEPDYDTFNKYPNEIYDYPENTTADQRDEFNNDIKIYYSSSVNLTFKLCSENCKTYKLIKEESDTKTKCIECKDSYKYYLDNNTDTYTCISNEEDCPKDSPFLITGNSYKCVESCDIEAIKDNNCILDNSSIESLSQVYTMFTDIITKEYHDEELVLRTNDDITFQLSNSINEKQNLLGAKGVHYNLSIIDLGECEDKLREANGLSNDISLIIFKIETYYENTTIKNVQYEIYNPVTRNQITDLSPCNEEKINIYVPTNLDNNTYSLYQTVKNQGYDIFNVNDSFYNDICTKFTSVNNTDITLNDRKEIFFNGSQIFCQENCEYKNINLETNHAQCECSVSSKNKEIELEKKIFSGFEIITSFYEVIKFSNFLVLKCHKLFFNSSNIKNNYGFFIMIIFISFHIVMAIIFLFTGINKIKQQMIQMTAFALNKSNNNLQKDKEKNVDDFKKRIFPKNPKKKKFKLSKSEKNLRDYNKTSKKKLKKFEKKNNNIKDYSSSWGLKKSSINILLKKGKKSSPLISRHKIKKKNKYIQEKYDEFELDDLEYLDAIKYDKRTFFQFFFCLVKREHLIIFTFFFCEDLNLLCIKLTLFIFSVSLDFSINVLFFTDDSMHKIYLDYGKYNFIQQIPQIIYSTVISELFDVFFKYLSLSEKEIYKMKRITSKIKASTQANKIMKKLKIKFLLFYSISFILMSFFCYFVSCFCAVYENTQATLFKDSLMSFLITLIYPFGLYLIPASIRIISLRSEVKDKRFLYKISNIFPLF